MTKIKSFEQSFQELKQYCENENFSGWDPYDGLNSKLFQSLPIISDSRFFRLAWIQLFKRNPINFRKIVGVAKGHNAKGLGLFLTAYCNLYKVEPKPEYLEKINYLSKAILELKNKNYSGDCWGYNFDWQARAFFQPKNTPTVVATSFISHALIQAYKINNDESLLASAISACDFVINDLNQTKDEDGICFSYSPLDKVQVFNASLLGAKILSEAYVYQPKKEYKDYAKASVEYVCKKQQENGAWAYGNLPYHQWIDNFHTGYNLECIKAYQKTHDDREYDKNIELGLSYYLNNFFTEEGMPKYYNNKLYPIDIHAPAQLVVTLFHLNELEKNKSLVDNVLSWTINNMQDSKGYFYYQKHKYHVSKIPYIRWAQAWMFYAFSYYFLSK